MHAHIFLSRLTDPFVNLAIENFLLNTIQSPTLFLYQNDTCVVIGRAQNPWLEADLNYLKKMNIPLVRRQSGGGTVVHDLGNLNFSFLSPNNQFDKSSNMTLVKNALATLGLVVHVTDHHDLFIRDKKVSGSAFRQTQKNCFHHGTLLIKSNLDLLRRCLNAPPLNIISTAVASRRSNVINLNEILPSLSLEQVKNALIESFQALHHLNSQDITVFSNLSQLPEIQPTAALYQSHEWLYHRTLPFYQDIIIQNQSFRIDVEAGKISKIEPFHDQFAKLINTDYYSDLNFKDILFMLLST